MRSLVPWVGAAVCAVPNVVFSIGCVLPGCGGGPEAPEQVSVEQYGPHEPSAEAPVGDTGTGASCVAPIEPGIELVRVLDDDTHEPLGDTVSFDYGGGCGSAAPTLFLLVSPVGLQPGPVDAAWSVTVDGEATEGTDTWEVACLEDGTLSPGELNIDLPLGADGAAVTIDVMLVDGAGTEASVSHTFVAGVTERP